MKLEIFRVTCSWRSKSLGIWIRLISHMYISNTFRYRKLVNWYKRIPRFKPHFFAINPTVGVPSTFGFAIFIFQVPERYAYLSGTGKLKCLDQKTKSATRTCLVQMIKWKQEFGNFTSRRKSSGFWID